jgi:hypothetical protein
MLNVISALFADPQTARDRQAVDLLEQHCPGLVQAISKSKTRDQACRLLETLLRSLEEVKDLTGNQRAWLGEWLLAVTRTVIPEDDRIGLQFS